MGKVKKNSRLTEIHVPGFCFAGVSAGIKGDPRKKDVALIYSTEPQTTVAGVFTQNSVRAAPVLLCERHLKNGQGRLIVTNSGIANAATSRAGLKDAETVARHAAKVFGLKTEEVFVCSTGKIGLRLPLKKVQDGILKGKAVLHPQGFHKASLAICTTDAYPKFAWHRGRLGGKDFTLAVMAKGAGMICPNMATMLCFVMTDLKISQGVLQTLLKDCVDDSLNCLTVDGDTSTNDTVLMFANGVAKNPALKKNGKEYNAVKTALTELLQDITRKIALDGEGATKCLRITVSGAKKKSEAQIVAKAIGNSPLVKTAMFGCDPNWGRILCAAGYSGVSVKEDKALVQIGRWPLFKKGTLFPQNAKPVAKYLQQNEDVEIRVDLSQGKEEATVWSSDLTYAYVKLNADYHT